MFKRTDSNFARGSTVGKTLSSSTACYREIIWERKSNRCRKLHSCLILRNCHSNPNFHQPPPRWASRHEHQGKNLHQQKDYILLKVQMIIWRRQWHPTPVFMPGKSHGWRSLVDYSPWGHEESDTNERLHFHFSLSCIAEGNGNPLQCSCPENPRDGGAWWAAIYGVAQCQTRLTWLSSGRWWLAFFSSKVFSIRYITLFSRQHYCPLNRQQYSLNTTFLCAWKPKNSCDSLCCNTHFIAAVWNWILNISEACLELFKNVKSSLHNVKILNVKNSIKNY